MSRKILMYITVIAMLLTALNMSNGVIAQEQMTFSTQTVSEHDRQDFTKWPIILLSLMMIVSLSIIFSPKKSLIDEIKIIEESE